MTIVFIMIIILVSIITGCMKILMSAKIQTNICYKILQCNKNQNIYEKVDTHYVCKVMTDCLVFSDLFSKHLNDCDDIYIIIHLHLSQYERRKDIFNLVIMRPNKRRGKEHLKDRFNQSETKQI